MGCACNPQQCSRSPMPGWMPMLLGPRICSLVHALEEFLFQGSGLAVRSWLEVVKPGEKEEDEEEGGPDAR